MSFPMPNQNPRNRAVIAAQALAFSATLILGFPLAAQEQGPMKPPSSVTAAPARALPPQASQTPTAAKPESSGISNQQPDIPVDQIVKQFADHEAEFKTERDNFTYTQTVTIQTLDDAGRADGEYKRTSDVVFTPQGKRYEKDTYFPVPTLQRISLSQQDLDDLEHVQPFVLTTTELPKYDVKYVGREQVDELGTYVFDVGPKVLEKNQRYFQGRIWVESKDLEIVKSDGKAVPDIRKKNGEENVFPRFETFRENIEGHYWFPTYTRSNDTLHFNNGDVRIRMTVRYQNYKRFGVTVKIGKPTETQTPTPPDKNSR